MGTWEQGLTLAVMAIPSQHIPGAKHRGPRARVGSRRRHTTSPTAEAAISEPSPGSYKPACHYMRCRMPVLYPWCRKRCPRVRVGTRRRYKTIPTAEAAVAEPCPGSYKPACHYMHCRVPVLYPWCRKRCPRVWAGTRRRYKTIPTAEAAVAEPCLGS